MPVIKFNLNQVIFKMRKFTFIYTHNFKNSDFKQLFLLPLKADILS